MSHGCAPCRLEVASCFDKGVIETALAGCVGGYGNGFHEVSDCDLVVVDGYVDGGGGGAVGGAFLEVAVDEGVDYDLDNTLACAGNRGKGRFILFLQVLRRCCH